MKKLNLYETRVLNGGGAYCKICGYGNDTYRSKLNVAGHILKNHFGIFSAVYAWNIYKYRGLLSWSLGL